MFVSFLVTNGNNYELVKWNYRSTKRNEFHPELEWKRCVVASLRENIDYRDRHFIDAIVSCDRQPVFFKEAASIHRYNPNLEAVTDELGLLDVMIANNGFHPDENNEEFEIPEHAIN
jgi:hypothetical protein